MKKFNIDNYVNEKIKSLNLKEKSFESIYNLMFRDGDFVMFEYLQKNKIQKVTYKQCEIEIEKIAVALNKLLKGKKTGSMVGLYAQNSMQWIHYFWAILKCGFKPLLLNTRMDKDRLIQTLSSYDVSAIVSDSEVFDISTILMKDVILVDTESKINNWENQIIVMSSGTTLKAKLCVYDGENFYYQLLDSANIIKQSKKIKKHYEGNLKQLMFLPLYHIFGLSAMFMWFAFFQRTFVLLKDQSPDTILFTIRKHKVTHIFAVPLFWETVYKKFMIEIKKRGEKTLNKFNKGLKIIEKTKSLLLAKLLFKEVRDNIFGESIQFLISGGSCVSPKVLQFFNSIGYTLANGFGMSEIGITSVELSAKYKNLTDTSVGKPFSHVQYKIDEHGLLYARGKSMAKEIYIDGEKQDYGEWYNTLDIAKEIDGRYYICGRKDDMVVCSDGENINPEWLETQIVLEKTENHCIISINGTPSLLIQVSKHITGETLSKIKQAAMQELVKLNAHSVIKNVVFTLEPLLLANEFKISRKRLSNIKLLDETTIKNQSKDNNSIKQSVREIFAKVLNIPANKILDTQHFFFDLKGSSLDYFALLSLIEECFDISFPELNNSLYTVEEFARYVEEHK